MIRYEGSMSTLVAIITAIILILIYAIAFIIRRYGKENRNPVLAIAPIFASILAAYIIVGISRSVKTEIFPESEYNLEEMKNKYSISKIIESDEHYIEHKTLFDTFETWTYYNNSYEEFKNDTH